VYKLYRCQGSHIANQKDQVWSSNKRQRSNRRLLWRTGLSGVPPDSVRCTTGHVRCTRGLQLELATFGNFQRHSRYNSPDCPVLQGRTASGTRQPRVFTSAAPLKITGLSGVHRTVRCICGATATSGTNGYLRRIYCAPARAEVRHAHAGAPDTLQCMSGAPSDIKAGPEVRTPTVDFQRH
jgi:hypothetical protein